MASKKLVDLGVKLPKKLQDLTVADVQAINRAVTTARNKKKGGAASLCCCCCGVASN